MNLWTKNTKKIKCEHNDENKIKSGNFKQDKRKWNFRVDETKI